MKKFTIISLLLLSWGYIIAQEFDVDTRLEKIRDSLKQELKLAKSDTSRVWLLYELVGTYRFNRPDSAIYYGVRARTLAREINFPRGETWVIRYMAIAFISMGNYTKAMQLDLEGLKLADKHHLPVDKVIFLSHMGIIHIESTHYAKAIPYLKESVALADSVGETRFYIDGLTWLARASLSLGQIDSAKYYVDKAFKSLEEKIAVDFNVRVLTMLGEVNFILGEHELAKQYFLRGIKLLGNSDRRFQFQSIFPYAEFLLATNNYDSGKLYLNNALRIAQEGKLYSFAAKASNFLATINKATNIEKAFLYKEMSMAYQDSLVLLNRSTAIQDYIDFDEQNRQRELEDTQKEYESRIRTNIFLGSSFTLLVIAGLLFVNNRNKQKAKQQIEGAYNQLKSTQSQLIQSEKMASLGELTAGIAHEIQNPLNFVNNFSEVNSELVTELEAAANTGNLDEIKSLVKDIKENETRINQHGKRADGIVKSMLQHSQKSSGQKELTDINALCDEYLRLAFHGMRAKDKSFNAKFETHFDSSLPKINVVPQDIGRVILNLINNAFYAVNEKFKVQGSMFEPLVTLSTKKIENKIEITVKDNGNGIPENVKEKIFQPFFTTKPTGQGTGLGLSLAYDIVTKGHGGTLEVSSENNGGTEFRVSIPLK